MRILSLLLESQQAIVDVLSNNLTPKKVKEKEYTIMNNINITDTIKYIGVDDKTIDLFESQYVVPNGVSYNSYIIFDEKVAVMDSVDLRAEKEWFAHPPRSALHFSSVDSDPRRPTGS